jgi:hypothetical protein
VDGATTQSEPYVRTQCLVTGPEEFASVHENYPVTTAALKVMLADYAAKLAGGGRV